MPWPVGGVRAMGLTVAMVMLMLAAGGAQPQILDCSATTNHNWFRSEPAADDDRTEVPYTIHLDARSGEWYLSNAHSAALTVGGGSFSVLSNGTAYPFRWIGLDDGGATQLRIEFSVRSHPFVFLGHDNLLLSGTCAEPAEPFLFLR